MPDKLTSLADATMVFQRLTKLKTDLETSEAGTRVWTVEMQMADHSEECRRLVGVGCRFG